MPITPTTSDLLQELAEESLSLETDEELNARVEEESEAFCEDPEKAMVKLAHGHSERMQAMRLRFLAGVLNRRKERNGHKPEPSAG